MKPSLQTRLGQQLTLTPQLRQAIRLLQLSALELEAELNEALESNPLLERGDEPEASFGETAGSAEAAPAGDESGGDPAEAEYEPAEASEWQEASTSERRHDRDDGEDSATAAPVDLHAHLLWQLHLSHLSPRDLAIGQALVEAINDDGYLEGPLADIQAALAPEIHAGEDEIECVLRTIHQLDPVGVGARNLSECLCVQMALLSPDTPGLALARELARGHLDALARLGPLRLGVQLGRNEADMLQAVALLRSLDPRPGAQVGGGEAEYIAPDAVAYRHAGVWKVVLAAGSQPRLAINRHYEGLIGKASREDDSYLRGQLQEARWLIKSLETRADTLLRVARAIVRQQSGFLDHGNEAMRPLTLREVAEELGLHESTISRATTRKYLRTPRGTFEFKYFFSSGIATEHGGAASATAIQAMMRKLVDAEDPRAPLSDQKLAEVLKSEGIPVARRTVAKYREAMNIPASNERQRLG
ncbi:MULTISPECIES: RNA polymerase factor sigma-54 [unclassified Arenimonas]|uniref:RNA polymerase factor sigma-54 n=1 Tax=unclassified Arenimonas TaxID=2641713 RepID=UPI00086D73FF|nr:MULTISPECIES: RNA polymerase factor sigma-54 [unclassified Arenimonas]ODS63027.1 MAG: RNA polymerase factor sigma-54 [Arenimonas sp. SCN 70-307]